MTDTTIPAETVSDSDLAQQVHAWMKGRKAQQITNFAAKFGVTTARMHEVMDFLIVRGLARTAVSGGKKVYGCALTAFASEPTTERWIPPRRPLVMSPRMKEIQDAIAEQRRLFPSKHL